eukprot:149315_1
MAASTYNQIHYKNDDYEHETVVKRVPSYDEDIVNQLETFGYATRTECINASYKCVDYKNPNEVIQRIDDEQSNSIHAYEHDCISITSNINNSNINNIIKPSPSPPPGPPPPLYRNKRHMLQFPQTQNDIYPCPNIIIQEWTEESQPPSPTNASPVPDFTEDDEIDTYQQILVKKNTGSRSKLMPIALEIPPFLQLMKTLSLSNDIEEDDAKDIDNNTDSVQLYQVIRDITDMSNHDDATGGNEQNLSAYELNAILFDKCKQKDLLRKSRKSQSWKYRKYRQNKVNCKHLYSKKHRQIRYGYHRKRP